MTKWCNLLTTPFLDSDLVNTVLNWQTITTTMISIVMSVLAAVSPWGKQLWRVLTARRRNTKQLQGAYARLRELNIVLLMKIRQVEPDYVPENVSALLDNLTAPPRPPSQQPALEHNDGQS